jgi:DNA-binding NtrC family response regulator
MVPARILLVDDDADMLHMVAVALQSRGYICHEATTGAEALAAVDRECPDVIISDLVMPQMGGIDLLKTVKAKGCGSEFFLLTGHACVRVAVEAIEQGADECLVKPVQMDYLQAILERRGFFGREERRTQQDRRRT